ncbi:MAG: hypothetical protein ABI068_01225 [Ktedonobacterales bacterium]
MSNPSRHGQGESPAEPRAQASERPQILRGTPQATVRLQDIAQVDRDSVFPTPRTGDWILLGFLSLVLLGNGLFIWSRLGWGDHVGRAAFFGLALLCVFWAAIVYTFKLSVSVRVGPQGISITRGPWRMELRWSDVSRLMERAQALNGRRYRWVVAQARDGRRVQVREDMVNDYARFRVEVYERYRLWRDHGGTWGTTGGGPFTARELIGDEVTWLLIGLVMSALPGLYFVLLLPETNPLGYALLLITLICAFFSVRALVRRQTYTVDNKAISSRALLGGSRMTWHEITRVERTRHPVGGIFRQLVGVGGFAVGIAARSDAGIRTFAWQPRVPEYLTLRGGGHQVRVRLHHLRRPDELLAWVEFYDQVARLAPSQTGQSSRASKPDLSQPQRGVSGRSQTAPDLSDASGPRDPWGGVQSGTLANEAGLGGSAGLAGMPASATADQSTVLTPAAGVGAGSDADSDMALDDEDAWLRETSALASLQARRPRTDPPVGADAASAMSATRQTPQPQSPQQPPSASQPPRHSQPDLGARFSADQPLWPSAAPTEPPAPATSASQRSSGPPAAPVQPPQTPPAPNRQGGAQWPQAPVRPRTAQRQPASWPEPPMPRAPQQPRQQRAEPARPSWDAWEQQPPMQPAARPPEPLRGPAPAPQAGQTDNPHGHADDGLDGGDGSDDARPWRDANWQPPVLPRFGPPPTPRSDDE